MENDSFLIGQIFEEYLMTWKENLETIVGDQKVGDMSKIFTDLETLKHNAEGLEFERGLRNVKVEWTIFGYPFEWYLDNLTDTIDDIKTCHYLTDTASNSKNMWSWMTTYEEYELQLWIYMKLKGITKARILEVSKFAYKDKRHAHQIIEFEMTEEFDKKMSDRYEKIVKEMVGMLYAHWKVLDWVDVK